MSAFAAASPRRKAAAGSLIVLLAWGLTLGLSLTGILNKYILTTLDHLYRASPITPASSQVVVVTVDQPDLDFFKTQGVTWPWPRQLYAHLIAGDRIQRLLGHGRPGYERRELDVIETELVHLRRRRPPRARPSSPTDARTSL